MTSNELEVTSGTYGSPHSLFVPSPWMKMKHIAALVRKDFTIDVRQKYAVSGVLLFAVGSAFIIYRTFPNVNAQTWNILLWIITMYAGINAVAKSFTQEAKQTYFYYYSLVTPEEVVLSKLIYNTAYLLMLVAVILLAFTVFLTNPVEDVVLFGKGLLLGVLGMSVVLTFVSAVAGTNGENATLMSVLALPLMLPSVMLMVKVTAVAMGLITDTSVGTDLLMLAAIDLILGSLVLIIFPTLWRS